MGTDIHMHIELKHEGVWHHFAHPRVTRNYPFFSLLADCRRCEAITPIVANRGVPDDMSLVTRIDWEHYKGWAHGASWLGRTEIHDFREAWGIEAQRQGLSHLDADLEHGRFYTYLQGSGIDDIGDTPYEDVRLVFWFDC